MPTDDLQPFWRQELPADDSAPEDPPSDTPTEEGEPPDTITVGENEYVVFPQDRLNTAPDRTVGDAINDLAQSPDYKYIDMAGSIASAIDLARSSTSAMNLPLDVLGDLKNNPVAMATMGLSDTLNEQMLQVMNPLNAMAKSWSDYNLGTVSAALANAARIEYPKIMNTARDLLNSPVFGIDWDKMKNPLYGVNWGSLAETLGTAMKASAARDRRNRDRAPQFLTEQHVSDVMGKIDFAAFLDAQHDDDTIAEDTQLITQLRTAINDPANIELRKDVTRELLYVGWVTAAGQWGFDGDDSIEYEWKDDETGEIQQYTATGEDITEVVLDDLERSDADGWRAFSAQYIERDILAGFVERGLREYEPPPPLHSPAFNPDGIGYTSASIAASGAQLSMVAEWSGSKNEHPVFAYTNGAGITYYTPSPELFPTAESAWKIVSRLSDPHADIFDYILCKYIANRQQARGPYGGIYVSADEFLDARGIKKHVKGGHKPENIEAVATQIRELSHINVTGQIKGYTKPQPGKRRREETLTIEAPLIVVSHTVKRKELPPGGRETAIAWYLRPGDWAADLEQLSEQYAVTMQSILRLNAKADAYAKRIARYLITQYRIRAYEGNWKQPYKVSTLLAGSGISIDRKNPKRFRERIEAALDTLQNPDYMPMRQTCIDAWHYPQAVATKGYGWLQPWLDSGVVVMPPATLTTPYQNITARRSRRSPRKLTG